MTHEELVERVAESIAGIAPLEKMHGAMQKTYKGQAREAIRIVGEACCDICTSKVPHYSTNVLIDDSTDGHHSGVVYATEILSLTQGNKT